MAKSTANKTTAARQKDDGRIREAQDDPHRLAQVYLRTRGMEHKFRWSLRFWRDDWWLWEGRCYRRLSYADLAADLTNAIKREFNRCARRRKPTKKRGRPIAVKVTRAQVGNVVQALRGLVLVRGQIEQPTWLGRVPVDHRLVAVTNGLVDLDRLVAKRASALRPHSPDWFSPVCLPYAFDARATCSRWLAFLAETFEGDEDRIALLQEWFGYCLIVDTSFQRFLILVGEGANGKTVLVNILIALLGEQNVSHVPLELFKERFQLTPTLGKLANIVSEIGRLDPVAEATVKAFVAGDAMYFDRKNQDGVNTRPTARVILAANTLPEFADRSRGLWRRLILVPCNVSIPVERQDRQLGETLKAELPGIFNWSLQGLRRLLAQRRFTDPTVCRQFLEANQAERNPERAFLLEEVRQRPEASVVCGELYARCQTWCEDNGYVCGNPRQFGKEVQRAFPGVKRQRDPGGRGAARPYRYLGLELLIDPGDAESAAA
jgi:putative DNA primase/helicase